MKAIRMEEVSPGLWRPTREQLEATAERFAIERDEARRWARRGYALAGERQNQAVLFARRVERLEAERDAIRYAAHMPDDYEYGLASWINQHLYGRLIELLDKDGLPIRRSEDIARMINQQQEIDQLRAEITQLKAEQR